MDHADYALAEQLQFLDSAIAAARGDLAGGAAIALMPLECDGCGVEIPARRLELLPSTRHCVACAHDRERRRATTAAGWNEPGDNPSLPADNAQDGAIDPELARLLGLA